MFYNSPDTQDYAKNKVKSYFKFLFCKNPTVNQPIAIDRIIPNDPVNINEESSNELKFLKRRLMLHIHVEYTVLYCIEAIFGIYEENGFTVKGSKKMGLKTIFNDTHIPHILALYPPNSDIYKLLSEYCVMPLHRIIQIQAEFEPSQPQDQNIHPQPISPSNEIYVTRLGMKQTDLEGMPPIV